MWRRQFAVYVMVGLASAAVDVGLLWGLLAIGVWRTAAVGIGLIAGMVVNYLLHMRVTFRAASAADLRSVALYVSIVLVNYLITLGFVEAGAMFGHPIVLWKLASLPVIALIGFLFTRRFVFV